MHSYLPALRRRSGLTASQACIVIQGLVDAIIYGINESSLSSWRNLIFPESYPTITALSSSPTAMLDTNTKKKIPSYVPRTRLSDMDDDSTSSFNVTMSPAAGRHDDSPTRGEATSSGWNSDSKEDVEMNTLNSKRNSVPGIRKTVEVNVYHEAAGPVQPPPPVRRFSRTKEGSTFFET